MNDDDRISRYLTERASAITLTPADAVAAVRRGTRRRNRRRGAIAGVAAVAMVATAVVVVGRGEPDTAVDSGLAATVVATPLDWTVVSPETGLGYGRSTAVAGGAVYSLSTAPGPATDDATYESHLYRSTDGAEWAEVPLPDGVRPSTLAASGDALYAIGTAPAAAGGGARDLVVSTSVDAASTWTSVTLPADVAELEARHPGEIAISQPAVAALDADHLVASVVVTATPDIEALIPGVDPESGWEVTPDGVTVYEMVPCAEGGADAACRVASPTTAVDAEGRPVPAEGQPSAPKVAASYTWDELGLDPELRALLGGQTYVYVADDGASFQRADLPPGATGWGGQLLAADDGYVLFIGSTGRDDASTQVLRSVDGHSWTAAGTLPGSPQAAGIVGGRPAVSLYGAEHLDVLVAQPDGSWLPLDLASAVDQPVFVQDVAFGPLGMVAAAWTDGSPGSLHLIHSLDGTTLSSVALADHVEGPVSMVGLGVTADAIVVRVDGPPDADPATLPVQQVLVGTPR